MIQSFIAGAIAVSAWDVTQARGNAYEIDFETDEGTFMSVDVSPDGRYLVFDLLAHIIAEGGHGAIGSHGQHHGLGSHWEVWMAASALGPMGALEVASLGGAHFLGLTDELGSLEAGKIADLIVLDKNPLDDIRNTKEIHLVMKDGVLYDGATLDEIWPHAKPYGAYPWLLDGIYESDDRPITGR